VASDRNNGSKDAEEKFKEITEAYDVLRDPDKRAAYDRYGEAGLRGAAGGASYHHVDLSEALNIFMKDFGGFGGLGDLFQQGGRRQGGGPRTGQDVKITVELTLAEVASGVTKTFTVSCSTRATSARGAGRARDQAADVPHLRGSGEVRRHSSDRSSDSLSRSSRARCVR
jgi:molecular chaperone DnaJ